MNIAQIKKTLDMPELSLNTATDAQGKPTVDENGKEGQWLRHWDNDSRTAVSIHRDLFEEIKKDSSIATLGLQTESRLGEKGDYTAKRIVKYAAAEHTL